MDFRTIYSKVVDDGIKIDPAENLTEQEHFGEVNIHEIMERARKTGQLSANYAVKEGLSGDFETMSYREMMDRINNAKEEFNKVPAEIRERFGNSPEAFVAFLGKEENVQEAVRLGLMQKRVEEPVTVDKAPLKALVDGIVGAFKGGSQEDKAAASA